MVILAGIDEAGYGPILGPLVVSCSAFSVPESLLGADLWSVLKKSIARGRKHLAGRLLIADSKKAYSRAIGTKELERTTLAALRCLGTEPTSYDEVLSYLCPQCLSRLGDYPWHRNSNGCSISSAADIRIASDVFMDDMAKSGIKLLSLRSFCLDVAYYNRLVSNVKNKAGVLFSTTASLIQNLWESFPKDNLQIIVDRQGGRVRYRKNLQRMFGELELHIISENNNTSTYELKDSSRMMRVHFVTKADDRFLPVALASMVSKYVREILVANINRYFLGFDSSLRPTAGYFKDGRRFIADIKTIIPHVQYQSHQLIRSR